MNQIIAEFKFKILNWMLDVKEGDISNLVSSFTSYDVSKR